MAPARVGDAEKTEAVNVEDLNEKFSARLTVPARLRNTF